ncbi:MAG: hypothetical protein GY810_13540 [Aureispira sp.]|nr:hypothetical protein [Aureispira sp.]
MQNIKIIITTLVVLCLILNTYAQSPDLINYQAVAYNSGGSVASSQAISVRVSILQGSTSGAIVYQETHNPATDVNGAFDLQIGGGSVQSGSFGGISWGSFSHYLRVEMDVNGGTNYSVMGTSQMVSVPYAKYAETAGSVGADPVVAALDGAFLKVSKNCTVSNCSYDGVVGGGGAFEEVHKSKNSNTLLIKRQDYNILSLPYNPSTLAVTGATFESYDIGYTNSVSNVSATIAPNYDTITVSYTITDSGGVCQCTNTYTRK